MPIRRFHICLFLAALFLSISRPCLSQEKAGTWYGSANVMVGTNFDLDWADLQTLEDASMASRQTGSFDGKVGWKSSRLDIKVLASGSSSFHMTSFVGISGKVQDRDTTYNLDLSQRKTISSDFLLGTEMSLLAGVNDVLSFRFHYKQEHQTPYNASYGLKTEATWSAQSQEENGTYLKNIFRPKIDWTHSFDKSGRKLLSSFSLDYAKDVRSTIWTMINASNVEVPAAYDSTGRIYRLTPEYVDNDMKLSVKYVDPSFCDVKNLNMEFSLDVLRNVDKDKYSGANLVKEHWIDSVRLNESFHYVSITVDPRIRTVYSIGKFKFDWVLSPQYFSDRLTNSVEDERFDAGRVDFVCDLKNWWIPNEHHRVSIKYGKSITRPDYLQMCWFQRPGVFSNELRQGNPDLLPMSTYTLSTEYGFTWNKFSTSLEIGYKSKYDQIEQTYNTEEIEGKTFRVYTWINAGRSETENIKLTFGWRDKVFKAGVSANVNHFYGFSADGTRSTDSYDMEVKADVSAKLPWDVTILADGRYQSAITRVYGSMSSYVSCNAKITKSFRHFNIFIEGRDLFDKPVTVETYSEDGNEGRYEDRRNNRRLFKLGAGVFF